MKKLKNIITTIAAITLFLCGSCTEYASNTQIILCILSAVWLSLISYAKSRKKNFAAR